VNGCVYDDGDGDVFSVNCIDLYARQNGVFTLLSKGPSGGSAPYEVYPNHSAASEDAQHVTFFTHEALTPDDTDGGYDDLYLSARAFNSLGYARPKGASPIFTSLVPAFERCTSSDRTHGAPLSFGSCSTPTQSSPNLTVGTPDANGNPTGMVGWINATVYTGDPLSPPDEADLLFQLSFKDVRRRSDFADYTGELKTQMTVRRTDRESGDVPPTIGIPATTADFPFSFVAPCTATASTSVGSTCGVNTSADALVPDAISEGTRMIWALDKIQVYDGGPDGDADTANNSLFATQGVFVP
jgi:hypothetical protein